MRAPYPWRLCGCTIRRVAKRVKVSTSKTTSYNNWITGQRVAVTKTYAEVPRDVHQQVPAAPRASRWSRFARFVGISPWNPKRFAIAVWVFIALEVLSASTAGGFVFVALSAAVLGGWKLRQRKLARAAALEAAKPPAPIPGPVWCDHCAEWTVHETSGHRISA